MVTGVRGWWFCAHTAAHMPTTLPAAYACRCSDVTPFAAPTCLAHLPAHIPPLPAPLRPPATPGAFSPRQRIPCRCRRLVCVTTRIEGSVTCLVRALLCNATRLLGSPLPTRRWLDQRVPHTCACRTCPHLLPRSLFRGSQTVLIVLETLLYYATAARYHLFLPAARRLRPYRHWTALTGRPPFVAVIR